ncbi:hypothetical protein [Microbacterium sp.]|uniref:hypothetical protein n=1 Tax=Microbacterium sp. TaxID=51671 RepID=UPI0039E27BBE
MIIEFAFFLICLIGGFWLFGLAQEATVLPALVFVAGILAISIGLAFVMRARGGATNRGPVRGAEHREQ